MRSIWKYNLGNSPGIRIISVPGEYWQILTVQAQGLDAMIWLEVERAQTPTGSVEIEIKAVMTGQEPPQNAAYIGTVQFHHGEFVLHYYRTGP